MGKVSSLLSPSPHKLPPMESLSKTHRKPLKKAKKAKREPIKVVYISNPMRVVATVAEFRTRVQELTGRDSDITATAADYSAVAPAPVAAAAAAYSPVAGADRGADLYSTVASPFGMFDEAFTSRVFENFLGFMPSSLCYETPPSGAFRGLDQV